MSGVPPLGWPKIRLYIALQGPALPVRIDGGSGSMSVAGYGEPVTLVAPLCAIDFSRVKV